MKYICLGGKLHGEVIDMDGRPEFHCFDKMEEAQTISHENAKPPSPIPLMDYSVYIKQVFSKAVYGRTGFRQLKVHCYVLLNYEPSRNEIQIAWEQSRGLNETK